MSKLTKKQLTKIMDSLLYVLNDSYGAVGDGERGYAVERIKCRGLDLINALEGDLNKLATELAITEGEALVDRSTRTIESLTARGIK